MNVHYTARQITLTQEMKDYCAKRLGRMRGRDGDILEVHIILTAEKNRNRAEIHVKAKGAGVVVEEETLDMMASLKEAFDNLDKKIKKEREKWRERKRRGGRERKELPSVAEAPQPEKRIIRSQNFSAKPMSLEEALVQLDIKDKEAFVFRRQGSEKWSVLFRRKDGHIGLVEPE